MNKEYRKFVRDFWKEPDISEEQAFILFDAVCFAGEAGEVCDSIKKLVRGRENLEDVKLELGDTLYYFVNLCNRLGFSLEDVMTANVEKLKERRKKAYAWAV